MLYINIGHAVKTRRCCFLFFMAIFCYSDMVVNRFRDSFAFCTEPVFASLANCLGRHDNLGSPLPFHLSDFEFLEVEIKHGLLQVKLHN